MTSKKISRRDFLKLGGLSAVSLPVIRKVGNIGDQILLESEDMYGGFLVRQLEKDNPPYEVDDSVYKRFNAKYGIFSRNTWDEEYLERVEAIQEVYEAGQPGYEWPDIALNDGAMFCATYDGTGSSIALMGRHEGLLGLQPDAMTSPYGPVFEGRWDHSHLSGEELTAMVKKAALFLGASLVGIAPLDERWIYSHYYDPFTSTEGSINFTEVEEVVLPEGQVSVQEAGRLIKAELETWEGEEIKELLIEVLETADSSIIPDNAPSVGMVKVLPANQFHGKLNNFLAMPAPFLGYLAEKMGMSFEIANIDPGESAKPRYLDDDTLAIPETMKFVIVLGFEMDYDGIETSPTTLSNAATLDGYSRMAITGGSLAQFIRGLGYNAIPCGNNTGISVVQAIDAGLGEQGRNGILITPKYGPRVRLAKVITDLPLVADKPIKFGVEEFCEICGKCANMCPTGALPKGEKSMEAINMSNNPGAKKWYVDGEKCYFGWHANGSGCGICIRVCPFNKPEGWLHDVTRILIGAKTGPIDKLLLNLDTASGYGTEEPKFDFWESDNFVHLKG